MGTFTVRGEPDPFVAVPNVVLLDSTLSVHDRIVWMGLKYHRNRNTGLLKVSHDTLAAELGVSKRTVQNSIRNLVDVGLVAIHGDTKGGSRPNDYELLTPWHLLPPDTDTVASPATQIAPGATPGMAPVATEQEDESTRSAREEIPHHYCRAARRFIDTPIDQCDDCEGAAA